MHEDLTIEIDREVDGRRIADIPAMPGVMVYGTSGEDAIRRVKELANRVLEERRNEEG
jgi:predicted RNase H-like HicB family nuclease